MQSPLWINVGNDSDYSDMTSRTDLHQATSSSEQRWDRVFTLEPESVSELDPAMTLEEALAIADGYQPCKLRDPVIKNTHYRHDRPSYQSPSLYSRVWTLSPSPLSVEFPQTSVVTTRVSEHIELRQEPYTKGIKARLINAEPLSVHVGAPEIGCRLDLLLEKKYEEAGMPDHAALAFPGAEFGQKMSFRFLFCNYPQYNGRQVNVCGTVQGVPQQPTKGHLATLAAREMVKQYIPKHPVSRFPYNEYQISLYAIDMPSKGTLQPRFQCIL
ncbi:hypothetical protein C8Q80DRAFT_1265808 [Daedaleopsis nitida]|nr:hypothetical protein C8Q80DRAFT_1265808 [Daedaleopsis nitida]